MPTRSQCIFSPVSSIFIFLISPDVNKDVPNVIAVVPFGFSWDAGKGGISFSHTSIPIILFSGAYFKGTDS